MAIAFTVLLNAALLATFWDLPAVPNLPTWAMPVAAWVLVLGFWVLATWLGRIPHVAQTAELDELFRNAQSQYLKGHWLEAETQLRNLLAGQPADVEGRLLLASVFRRTGRLADATRLLNDLKGDVSAGRWQWEIQSELLRITGGEASGMTRRRAA
jgi:hypothetical protein